MTDHDADVAAVLAGVLDPHWREGQVARAEVKLMLAALTAAGIACVYVPEGVEVEHGARLVDSGSVGKWLGKYERVYAIEATP